MTRAIARFTVSHGRLRIKVRLLPTIRDVDAEYREGRRRRDGKWTYAFFEPAATPGAAHVGTVVLPADGRLSELVPHEVTHAVLHRHGYAHCSVDEPVATAIGKLSASIFRQLQQRGLEV